jgi:hypothetical protein
VNKDSANQFGYDFSHLRILNLFCQYFSCRNKTFAAGAGAAVLSQRSQLVLERWVGDTAGAGVKFSTSLLTCPFSPEPFTCVN